MTVGDRFRSGRERSITRFLAEHQACDAGFDVHRDSRLGGGRLRVTCKGCGRSVEYQVAEVGELAAAQESTADAPSRGLPGWAPLALISALILAGLGLIVFGVLGSETGDEPSDSQANPPRESTTAPITAATTTAQPPAAATQGAGAKLDVKLDRRGVPGVFTIGVAPRWSRGTGDGAVILTAPGDVARIAIYFESGERSAGELAGSAAEFLDDRHSDGQVAAAQPVRIGRVNGHRVTATFPGGSEDAVVLSAEGYSYLLLRQVDAGAPARISGQAKAQLTSFRPG